MDDFNKKFGARLRFKRKQAGFNQGELADLIGVSQAAVCSYEAGRISPPLTKIIKIGEILEWQWSKEFESKDKPQFASDFSYVDFSVALIAIKSGKRLRRAGWNGKGMFVFLVDGSTFKVSRPPLLGIYPEGTEINYHAHIDMRTADGQIVPWLALQADLLATDWETVDDDEGLE